jgi:methylated-DNA-protein-cysteine methyltransferase-like protein
MNESPRNARTAIFFVVQQIPAGKVLTYGDVAAMAGMPRAARLVGNTLHGLPQDTQVPWHRVVNHKGGLSTGRAWPGGDRLQRSLLEAEGVRFDERGRLSLREYRWTNIGDS